MSKRIIIQILMLCLGTEASAAEYHCGPEDGARVIDLLGDLKEEMATERSIILSVSDSRTAMRWCTLVGDRLRTFDKLARIPKECLGEGMIALVSEGTVKDEKFLEEKCR